MRKLESRLAHLEQIASAVETREAAADEPNYGRLRTSELVTLDNLFVKAEGNPNNLTADEHEQFTALWNKACDPEAPQVYDTCEEGDAVNICP